jgi:type IV secretory pathway VirB10-like protein
MGRRRYALWYIQHEGSRSYVRVTGLGLLAAVIFTLIPALLILTLFFRNEAQQQRDLENVNITIAPRTPDNSNYPVIRPAPPPPPLPKIPKRPAINAGNVAVTPTPGRNTNGR